MGKVLYRISSSYEPSGSVSEGICRTLMQSMTGKFFLSVRPTFLTNPSSGRCLELDGYNEELKLAFEYNGVQHYVWPNKFHKNKGQFLAQVSRDKFKQKRCKELGINLLVIPYTVKRDDLEAWIRRRLSHMGYIKNIEP